ncbi:MAG: reverse transcriptase family protein [Planctomycetaceae bacterium]
MARLRWCGTTWLDLTKDGDVDQLERQGLPVFQTPEELAGWLGISLGRLAWLTLRFDEGQRAASERQAHYHYRWAPKRSGGRRLIEAPKPAMRRAQQQILREILDKVPPHPSCHGFTSGRSILTNAAPHSGQRVVVRFDLENFYPTVTYSRVVAIFRSLGYCREAAIWLAQLVTSTLPTSSVRGNERLPDWQPFLRRHLPQGAATSPALANLSAFSLDLRLSGLARTFGARYTRYADDLTFSGDEQFLRSLAVFIPLTEQVVRSERFRTNKGKRRILRSNQRQRVAGVVVNERPNVCRADFERLKAILTNCVRRGPSTQNHDRHPDFAAHLRGRVAHVSMLNPGRGAKLLALFDGIDWNR